MSVNGRLAILAAVSAAIVPGVALAYVGPGAGLGMIGSLIAVVGVVLVAMVGLIILPFRMLQKRRRAKATDRREEPASAGSRQGG
jgi:uncharacterized membrane protein